MNAEKILSIIVLILIIVCIILGANVLSLRKSVESIRSDITEQLNRNNQLESDIDRQREAIHRGTERAEQQLADNDVVRGVIREIQKNQQLLENDDVHYDWNYSDFISDNNRSE